MGDGNSDGVGSRGVRLLSFSLSISLSGDSSPWCMRFSYARRFISIKGRHRGYEDVYTEDIQADESGRGDVALSQHSSINLGL